MIDLENQGAEVEYSYQLRDETRVLEVLRSGQVAALGEVDSLGEYGVLRSAFHTYMQTGARRMEDVKVAVRKIYRIAWKDPLEYVDFCRYCMESGLAELQEAYVGVVAELQADATVRLDYHQMTELATTCLGRSSVRAKIMVCALLYDTFWRPAAFHLHMFQYLTLLRNMSAELRHASVSGEYRFYQVLALLCQQSDYYVKANGDRIQFVKILEAVLQNVDYSKNEYAVLRGSTEGAAILRSIGAMVHTILSHSGRVYRSHVKETLDALFGACGFLVDHVAAVSSLDLYSELVEFLTTNSQDPVLEKKQVIQTMVFRRNVMGKRCLSGGFPLESWQALLLVPKGMINNELCQGLIEGLRAVFGKASTRCQALSEVLVRVVNRCIVELMAFERFRGFFKKIMDEFLVGNVDLYISLAADPTKYGVFLQEMGFERILGVLDGRGDYYVMSVFFRTIIDCREDMKDSERYLRRLQDYEQVLFQKEFYQDEVFLLLPIQEIRPLDLTKINTMHPVSTKFDSVTWQDLLEALCSHPKSLEATASFIITRGYLERCPELMWTLSRFSQLYRNLITASESYLTKVFELYLNSERPKALSTLYGLMNLCSMTQPSSTLNDHILRNLIEALIGMNIEELGPAFDKSFIRPLYAIRKESFIKICVDYLATLYPDQIAGIHLILGRIFQRFGANDSAAYNTLLVREIVDRLEGSPTLQEYFTTYIKGHSKNIYHIIKKQLKPSQYPLIFKLYRGLLTARKVAKLKAGILSDKKLKKEFVHKLKDYQLVDVIQQFSEGEGEGEASNGVHDGARILALFDRLVKSNTLIKSILTLLYADSSADVPWLIYTLPTTSKYLFHQCSEVLVSQTDRVIRIHRHVSMDRPYSLLKHIPKSIQYEDLVHFNIFKQSTSQIFNGLVRLNISDCNFFKTSLTDETFQPRSLEYLTIDARQTTQNRLLYLIRMISKTTELKDFKIIFLNKLNLFMELIRTLLQSNKKLRSITLSLDERCDSLFSISDIKRIIELTTKTQPSTRIYLEGTLDHCFGSTFANSSETENIMNYIINITTLVITSTKMTYNFFEPMFRLHTVVFGVGKYKLSVSSDFLKIWKEYLQKTQTLKVLKFYHLKLHKIDKLLENIKQNKSIEKISIHTKYVPTSESITQFFELIRPSPTITTVHFITPYTKFKNVVSAPFTPLIHSNLSMNQVFHRNKP